MGVEPQRYDPLIDAVKFDQLKEILASMARAVRHGVQVRAIARWLFCSLPRPSGRGGAMSPNLAGHPKC